MWRDSIDIGIAFKEKEVHFHYESSRSEHCAVVHLIIIDGVYVETTAEKKALNLGSTVKNTQCVNLYTKHIDIFRNSFCFCFSFSVYHSLHSRKIFNSHLTCYQIFYG